MISKCGSEILKNPPKPFHKFPFLRVICIRDFNVAGSQAMYVTDDFKNIPSGNGENEKIGLIGKKWLILVVIPSVVLHFYFDF